jgi:hypothetical protein
MGASSKMIFATVNDTLIFNGANLDHLRYLRALFLCFEVVFGLKINMAKSELIQWVMSIMWMVWLVFRALGFFFAFEISWSFIGGLF